MDSQYHQQYDTITSNAQITSLLSAAQEHQPAIKITLPNTKEVFLSSIVSTDFVNGHMLIEGLDSIVGHKNVIKHKLLKVFSQSGSADFSFTTRLIKADSQDGKVCYRVEMPHAIKYRQRRSSYRKHISLAQNITATIYDQEGKTYIGQLRDISSGGMKLQFDQEKSDQFVNESIMPECTLSLSEKNDIVCDFRVRHLRVNDRNNGFTVGGSFVALEHQQKRVIERFIADLERKSMRGYSA